MFTKQSTKTAGAKMNERIYPNLVHRINESRKIAIQPKLIEQQKGLEQNAFCSFRAQAFNESKSFADSSKS
jgi:hypothetical protein